MKEFSVRPKPRNNNAKIAFLVAILVSLASFVVYYFMEKYKGFVGLFGILTLATAILFYTKYISPVFSYDIVLDESGLPLFVVRKIVGKRVSTLCRIDMCDISSITHQTRAEMKSHVTPKGFLKYFYNPTLCPPDVYRITVSGRYEKAEIVIEASDEFAKMLLDYSEEAKNLAADSEDF